MCVNVKWEEKTRNEMKSDNERPKEVYAVAFYFFFIFFLLF